MYRFSNNELESIFNHNTLMCLLSNAKDDETIGTIREQAQKINESLTIEQKDRIIRIFLKQKLQNTDSDWLAIVEEKK